MVLLKSRNLIFIFIAVVLACSGDELDELNKRLDDLRSEVDSLDAEVNGLQIALSIVEAKNILYEKQQQNHLLISYETVHDTTYLSFEDNVLVAVPSGIIQKVTLDSVLWKAECLYNDSSIQLVDFLGNSDGLIIERTELNTSGFCPLMAIVEVNAPVAGKMKVTVKGKYGEETDISRSFTDFKSSHALQVFGLYAAHLNDVQITFSDVHGHERILKSLKIKTNELPAIFPEINVTVRQTEKMEEGLTLISYLAATDPSMPFIIDSHGDIRWYLDYSSSAELATLIYDNGLERLQNGNFYFGNAETDEIIEAALDGKIINTWPLSGYEFHHNVQEKPNGNFLVTVDKPGSTHLNGSPTIEDYIIEIDRSSGTVINEWDLKDSMDEYRTTMIDNLAQPQIDWIHINAVIYDPSDNSIIVSGRTQGIVKLTEDNKVKWILNMHGGWNTGRNGIELNQFLLTPLDAQNQAITDPGVLDGTINHPDFEWTWYQHAPFITPSGTFMFFDNGNNRNYTEAELYSRAVEYSIDETNMTVKQLWSYGKERGTAAYSRIVSDVDYLQQKGNVLFCPGFRVDNHGKRGAKIIEINKEANEVVFEVEINTEIDGVTLHRAERLVFN